MFPWWLAVASGDASSELAHFGFGTAAALLLVAFGAFLIPIICQPIRLPASVGEIIYGIVVGPHVLELVEVGSFLKLISEVGFFLLMFIAGLELNFKMIEQGGAKLMMRGVYFMILLYLFSYGLTLVFGWPVFLTMVISAISIGLPIVLLHESGLGRTTFGQGVLLTGSIGEFIVIVVATCLSAYAQAGYSLSKGFFFQLFELAAILGLAYVVLVIFRNLVWWLPEHFTRVVSDHDPSEIGMRAGLALMFMFVAVAAYFHIDPILGSFLAGALFSFVFRYKGALEMKFMSLGNGFLVPFFFIVVGLELDLPAALKSDWLLFFQMLISLVVVRWVAFMITQGKDSGAKECLASALLLSAPLTLLIVIANLGEQLGMIDAGFKPTIIMLAASSSTIYPLIFKFLMKPLGIEPIQKAEGAH